MTVEQAFLNEIGGAYLALAEEPHPDVLRKWRPSGFAWPMLRELQGRVAGLGKRHAQIDGERFVWLEGGNPTGTPVVLLHGFGASKENWLALLPFLGRRHRLYIPDLPGWGESHFRHGKAYGIDHQVERLAHWLNAHVSTRAPGGVHLVGSSMGGALAGFIAARHPELIRTLTLMNAAGVRGARLSEFEVELMQGRNSLVARSTADVFRMLTVVIERNRHLLATTLAPIMSAEIVSRQHVNTHMFHQLLGHAPQESLPGMTAVRAPTLVLWGEQDRVLDVSCADTYQQLIPHAQVKRLRGVGHLPMVEVPALTARCLQRFWRQAPDRAAPPGFVP